MTKEELEQIANMGYVKVLPIEMNIKTFSTTHLLAWENMRIWIKEKARIHEEIMMRKAENGKKK